jgi:hypothetical protein
MCNKILYKLYQNTTQLSPLLPRPDQIIICLVLKMPFEVKGGKYNRYRLLLIQRINGEYHQVE